MHGLIPFYGRNLMMPSKHLSIPIFTCLCSAIVGNALAQDTITIPSYPPTVPKDTALVIEREHSNIRVLDNRVSTLEQTLKNTEEHLRKQGETLLANINQQSESLHSQLNQMQNDLVSTKVDLRLYGIFFGAIGAAVGLGTTLFGKWLIKTIKLGIKANPPIASKS